MGGSSEQVIPTLIGTIVFVLLLAFIVSNLGPVGGPIGTEPGSGLSLEGTYVYWNPTSGRHVAWANASDHYNSYPLKSENFTYPDKSQITLFSIRNSTQYVSGSYDEYKKYHDYLILDQHGGFLGLGLDRFAISYATLNTLANSSSNSTYSSAFVKTYFTLNGDNYTLFVTTGPGGFTHNLWSHNSFNVTVARYIAPSGPGSSSDVLTVLWWIFTLNTDWLPTYPIVVYFVGLVIDAVIVLCVIRIIWGS